MPPSEPEPWARRGTWQAQEPRSVVARGAGLRRAGRTRKVQELAGLLRYVRYMYQLNAHCTA